MKVALAKNHTPEALGNLMINETATHTGGLSHSKENEKVLNHILISGIAEDKMAYGIREIMANAWDANRRRPFTIHRPTREEPWFSVRDFGPGISADTYQRYVMLGDSSKRNNNNVVGAFGLGAKSPFAYLLSSKQTPEYLVTSIHRGKKSIYIHGLTEEFCPTASLISSEDTDEPAGLEVQWTVLGSDLPLFNALIDDTLAMFPPDFRCNTPSEWVPLIEGVEHHARRNGQVYVRMGCVGYPTTLNIRGPSLLIDVPIGSCAITSSREALAWDDTTRDFVTSKVEEVMKAIEEHVKGLVLNAETRVAGLALVPERLRHLVPADYRTHEHLPKFTILYGCTKVGLHRASTTRLKERQAAAEVSYTYEGGKAEQAVLEELGFEVVDLTKITLPPRPRRSDSKKGIYIRRVINADGTVEEKSLTKEEASKALYVVAQRRGVYFYADDNRRYGAGYEAEVRQLLKELKYSYAIVSTDGYDVLRQVAKNMLDHIREVTKPTNHVTTLPPRWAENLDNQYYRERVYQTLSKYPSLNAVIRGEQLRIMTIYKGAQKTPSVFDKFHKTHYQPSKIIESTLECSGIRVAEIAELLINTSGNANKLVSFALEKLNAELSTAARQGPDPVSGEDDVDPSVGPSICDAA